MTCVSGGLSSCGSTTPDGFRPSNSSFLVAARVAKLVLAVLHFDIIYLNIVNNQLSCRVGKFCFKQVFFFWHFLVCSNILPFRSLWFNQNRGNGANCGGPFLGPPRTGYPLTPVHHTCASSASRPAKSWKSPVINVMTSYDFSFFLSFFRGVFFRGKWWTSINYLGYVWDFLPFISDHPLQCKKDNYKANGTCPQYELVEHFRVWTGGWNQLHRYPVTSFIEGNMAPSLYLGCLTGS